MSDTAEFPLAYDATKEERETARREIGRYTEIVGDTEHAVRFVGQSLGQTGPVWHLQYTRIYRVPQGYLAAARDLHEGIKVVFAATPEELPGKFDNALVREFLEDELRYRKIIGVTPAAH